jgi:hypothetical protein
MYPHRIRLRGPWECQRLDGAATAQRVTMPCRWVEAGLGHYVGPARFTRKFGYPGRLDESDRVWLTCEGLTGHAAVTLNGVVLADEVAGPFAFPVTPLLDQRNVLEVVIHGDDDSAGLWGEVALEIRTLAYLDDVQVQTRGDASRVVSGRVAGEGDHLLELYVLVNGGHTHYQSIRQGDRFETTIPAEATKVRIELIHVSVVWYVVEQDLA